MEVTVTRTVEAAGGKEYALTVTRRVGAQKIEVDGETVQVTELTVFDSPLGQSRCYTGARPEPSPEERAAARERVRETAARAMLEQGIW